MHAYTISAKGTLLCLSCQFKSLALFHLQLQPHPHNQPHLLSLYNGPCGKLATPLNGPRARTSRLLAVS